MRSNEGKIRLREGLRSPKSDQILERIKKAIQKPGTIVAAAALAVLAAAGCGEEFVATAGTGGSGGVAEGGGGGTGAEGGAGGKTTTEGGGGTGAEGGTGGTGGTGGSGGAPAECTDLHILKVEAEEDESFEAAFCKGGDVLDDTLTSGQNPGTPLDTTSFQATGTPPDKQYLVTQVAAGNTITLKDSLQSCVPAKVLTRTVAIAETIAPTENCDAPNQLDQGFTSINADNDPVKPGNQFTCDADPGKSCQVVWTLKH